MKSKKKIGIIIQSRSSSKRFKLKFKKKILNKSLIIFLLDRIKKDFENTKIIVAIPTGDKIIYDHLKKVKNIHIFSGSKNNVLQRYYKCAINFELDVIIRLTGDNPMIDTHLIKKNLSKHLKYKKLFTSNCYMNTFPNGLEFEILDIKLLKYILKLAKLNSDKEHVTPLIYKLIENKKIDKKKILLLMDKGNYKNIRLTVDKKNDLIVVNKVIKYLNKLKLIISFKNIIKVFKKNKNLFKLNINEIRDEGYFISKLND